MSLIRKSGRTIGRQERPGDFMITECYFCKGKVVAVKTEVDFRWGKKLKVLKDVPARVCQQCGEKYFEATIYKAMERLVIRRVKPSARMSVDVVQFKEAV
jgi:YgiT-type zinc finger domain-containing protein